VHEQRIIHRDIKPDNFLIGRNDSNKDQVFIIDFGLAKIYKNASDEHIPYREGKNLTGTARYASLSTHKGIGKTLGLRIIEQSRRDDLECIGHVLLYFLRGSLPWQGLPGKTKSEKYNAIKKKKLETPLTELCKGHPAEFKDYMEYCRSIGFTDDPDYEYLIGLFTSCLDKNGFDRKVLDYTWKRNRFEQDREDLKKSLMGVIGPKGNEKEQQKKIDHNSIAMR